MAKMYTCDEVAERYKVKVITVWDWIRQHKLNAIKLGREYRICEVTQDADMGCTFVEKHQTVLITIILI